MYAARDELVKRFGELEISSLEDQDGTGSPVPAVSLAALLDATQEADSYVAVRYPLPLPTVPTPLVVAVCDIARYRLYKDRPTEQVTYRYEAALKWLEKLAAGKVTIFFEPAVAPVEIPRAPVAIGVQYTGGVFGSATLDRMPGIGVP